MKSKPRDSQTKTKKKKANGKNVQEAKSTKKSGATSGVSMSSKAAGNANKATRLRSSSSSNSSVDQSKVTKLKRKKIRTMVSKSRFSWRSTFMRAQRYVRQMVEVDYANDDKEISAYEARLAGFVSRIPFLPVALQRGLFDWLIFLHDFFCTRTLMPKLVFVFVLIAVLGIVLSSHVSIPGLLSVSAFTSNLFAAIDTEERHRPGLRFFDTFNNGSSDLPLRHPVVILPGFITTGLEIWKANSTCLQHLGVTPTLRQWMLGPSMILLMLREPACWLHLFSLDPKTGLDIDGIRIRGGEGPASVGEFVPGFWVWEKIIRNLADIGYDQSNLAFATYDWRLSPDLMHERDGFYHRMRHLILRLYDQHQRRVIVIGHSYANTVLVHFLQWAEKQEAGFLDKYISDIINIGGLTLGGAKPLSASLLGDAQDTLAIPPVLRRVLDRVVEPWQRYNFLRTWSCLSAMLPHSCLNFEGGILQSGDDLHLNTSEALEQLRLECLRTGHTNCAKMVQAHLETTKRTLPTLPAAPHTTMFCLYGVYKATEVGYYVQLPNATPTTTSPSSSSHPVGAAVHHHHHEVGEGVRPDLSPPHRGLKLGNGDGTVPLPSLAYMCRAPNGWKKNLRKVVTMEFAHNTSQAPLLDFRGGRSSADHVDILGNHETLEIILRIVSGVEENKDQWTDRIISNVDEVLASPVVEKCREL